MVVLEVTFARVNIGSVAATFVPAVATFESVAATFVTLTVVATSESVAATFVPVVATLVLLLVDLVDFWEVGMLIFNDCFNCLVDCTF